MNGQKEKEAKLDNTQNLSNSCGQKQKPDHRQHTILRLGRYMIQYKFLLLLALFLTICSNLFSLIGPMLSGYAIDAIKPGMGQVQLQKVWFYAGWMVLFYLISSALSYGLAVLMIHISRMVVYRMRRDVFHRLMELPIGYFDTHPTGDIISRISYDIDTINTSLSNDFVQILATLITVVGALAMICLLYTSPSPRDCS